MTTGGRRVVVKGGATAAAGWQNTHRTGILQRVTDSTVGIIHAGDAVVPYIHMSRRS
jgi:hypothetical protein